MINKIFGIIGFIIFSFVLCEDFTYKELPILQSGRIKPLDTYSRNALLQFYGKKAIKVDDGNSFSSIDWLFESFINPNEEFEREIFNIRNPEVAFSLGLDKNDNHRYNFTQIIDGFKDNKDLLEVLKKKEENNQTLVDKQIIEIYNNILSYDQISHGVYCLLPLINLSNEVNREFMGLDSSESLSYSYFMRNIDRFRFLLQNLLDTNENDWNESHLEISKIAFQLGK